MKKAIVFWAIFLVGLVFAPFSFAYQDGSSLAVCGINSVSLISGAKGPYCLEMQEVACSEAVSVAAAEADKLKCPAACPVKTEVIVNNDGGKCGVWFDPPLGPPIYSINCGAVAQFVCEGEPLVEPVSFESQEFSTKEVAGEKPGLRKIIENIGKVIFSLLSF